MRFQVSAAGILVLAAVSLVAWRGIAWGLADSGRNHPLENSSAASSSTIPSSALAQPASGPKFVYREFGMATDTIWAASAADPEQRIALAQVDHAPGWGIRASLSADGSRLAFVADPSGGGRGQVWVMALDGGGRRLLAEGADVRSAPVWSSDGAVLAFVRDSESGPALVQVALDGSETVLVAGSALGLYPVAYSPTGHTLYFAQITAAGTDLGAVTAAAGRARLFAHISDSIARDWRLSPDGERIAYLAPQIAGGRVQYRAFTVSVAGGAAAPLAAGGTMADAHLGPVWSPDGRGLTLGRSAGSGGATLEMLSIATGEKVGGLSVPAQSLDVPVAWSPDGRYLVLRSLEGGAAGKPGREKSAIVTAEGARRLIPAEGDAEFVGWLPAGP